MLFLSISWIGFSQTLGSITGRVIDKQTQEVIPYSTVAIIADGAGAQIGAVTDVDGRFLIKNIKTTGKHRAIISFMGYKDHVIEDITIGTGRQRVDLGAIFLEQMATTLDEVVVSGKQSTVVHKIDRKSYNASDFATVAGGSAMDLLGKLPSVSVSPDGGSISVRGASDFVVYLNGKPTHIDQATLLGQIPNSSIKSIDVITVPSAQYDAQGGGGIINITTRTTGMQGLTVSAVATGGGSPWANGYDALGGRALEGVDLNNNRYSGAVNAIYGMKNISIHGGLSYSNKNTQEYREGNARLLLKDTKGDDYFKHMDAEGDRDLWEESLSANVGFDYAINDRSKLSASYNFGRKIDGRSAYYRYDLYYTGDDDIRGAIPQSSADEWIYNPNHMDKTGIFHSATIDYSYDVSDINTISASLLYENSSLEHVQTNSNYAYDPITSTAGARELYFQQFDDSPLDVYHLNINSRWAFDSGNELNIGVQPHIFNMGGKFNYPTIDIIDDPKYPTPEEILATSNSIDLNRFLMAAYIDFNGSVGKLNYILGLRAEYTDQILQLDNTNSTAIFDYDPNKKNFDYEKLSLFPSAHLEYNFTENSTLSASASRRINRPAVKEMAPFLYRNHFEVYQIGDPELKPEFSNIAEITYQQRLGKQKVGVTGFYRGVQDAIFRVNKTDQDEGVLLRSYTNSGDTRSVGAELFTALQVSSIWDFYLSGSLYNYKIKSNFFGVSDSRSSNNWSIKANTNIDIFKWLTLSADAEYTSGTITAQGNNEALFITNAAMSYRMPFVDGLSLGVKATNIFDSYNKGLDTRASALDANGVAEEIFYQYTQYQSVGPVIEFVLSYSFNPSNQKAKSARKSYGADEM